MAGGAPARSAVAAPVDPVTTAVHALSLEQKVGQLILIGFDGPLTPALKDHLRIHHFGGFLTVQMNINAKSPAALTETINTMQDVMDGDPPLFIATDQEGGTVCLKWASVTCFPGGRRLGLLPPDDAAVAERDMSEELYAMGFNLHLAPVADVWDGVHPFMIDRSYGTQAEAVSERVRAVIGAGHATGLAMTVKHFPGHGGASDNSHIVLPTVDHSREYLDRVDLPPFQAAIDAGVDVVMMGHLLVPAIDPDLPTSLSPKAHAILRDEWGYQGVIMSDDIEMGAIVKAKSPAVAAVEAVMAGTDMVLIARSTASQDAVYRALLAAVQDGRIPQERLDRSVERILRVKMKYRLSENRHSDPAWAASFVGAAGHRHDAAALIAR